MILLVRCQGYLIEKVDNQDKNIQSYHVDYNYRQKRANTTAQIAFGLYKLIWNLQTFWSTSFISTSTSFTENINAYL